MQIRKTEQRGVVRRSQGKITQHCSGTKDKLYINKQIGGERGWTMGGARNEAEAERCVFAVMIIMILISRGRVGT